MKTLLEFPSLSSFCIRKSKSKSSLYLMELALALEVSDMLVGGWVIRVESYCCCWGIDVGIEAVDEGLVVSEKEKDGR